MTVRFVASICVLLVGVPVFAVSPDWNQWRGPERDGVVIGSAWPESLSGRLTLRWEKSHQPSYSGPIISDGLVFTTETIDKRDERVTAYDLNTGETIWQTQWPGAMAVPFFAAANGDWIRATPACSSDALLVMGMRDVLVCLDPKTGEERWRVDFPQALQSPLPSFGACSSPLIDEGHVYVQTGGAVVKLALDDGAVVWKTLENSAGMMSGGAFSSPVIATLAGERQLVVQTRQELCGVDLGTGNVLWRKAIEAFRGMNILTPTVLGDRLFTAAHSGQSHLLEVSKQDNQWKVQELWSQKLQGYMSSPVVVDGSIYLHMRNQRVSALDVNDGSIQWTSSPMGKYWSMVSNADQILALDSGGDLLLLNASGDQFDLKDKVSVASDSWAHLAVQGNLVIVRDLGALKVFQWE